MYLFVSMYESESRSPQLCLVLCDPMIIARQAPLFMKFSRPEYWRGLLFPSPGDLSNPGTEPRSLHYRQILYI